MGEFWYIIDAVWISQWITFVLADSEPPGVISNLNLFERESSPDRLESEEGFKTFRIDLVLSFVFRLALRCWMSSPATAPWALMSSTRYVASRCAHNFHSKASRGSFSVPYAYLVSVLDRICINFRRRYVMRVTGIGHATGA